MMQRCGFYHMWRDQNDITTENTNTRDIVISEFWNGFYEMRTVGADIKVPIISPQIDKATTNIML